MSRILIIEDNAENLELMEYLLRASGFDLIRATDGEEGLKLAFELRPDMILCDIHMPGLNGLEVACTLRSDPYMKSIPLVAVTAFAMVGDRERILSAGFDMYVSKPIEPESFVSEIRKLLS